MSEIEGAAQEGLISRTTKSALIVVDVQNDFCHEEGTVIKNRKADPSMIHRSVICLLPFIEKCRNFHVHIILVRTLHSTWTDSPVWLRRINGAAENVCICKAGSWGSEFYKIRPEDHDYIVTKHRYSSFFGTDLDLILRSHGIETVLLTGVLTNVCVETTARDAVNRDYNVILVEDCCGALTRREHEGAVNNISRYFGKVVSSDALLRVLERTYAETLANQGH